MMNAAQLNVSLVDTLAKPIAARSQRVQMGRAELDLYVCDGRPTGRLLRSVALLKGLEIGAIAKSSGIPEMLVRAIFADHGSSSIKNGAIKRIALVLGIDLTSMRFASGQVHIFDLANIPNIYSKSRKSSLIRAVGLLARGSRIAKVRIGHGIKQALSGRHIFVAQQENFRALFTDAPRSKFNVELIPSAQWVRGTQVASVVNLKNEELISHLKANDLTEAEFDELFLGGSAFTWDDVHVASRVNGVSKIDLMEFIRERAEQLDATEDNEVKRIVNEDRPAFLRLVESELKVAVG